jgi:hypothetical protein
MQLLKKIPFFLFLLALFFCLNGSVDNFGFVTAGELLVLGLKIGAATGIAYALVYLCYHRYLAAALIVFFIGCWYLFFGALHDVIKSTAWLSFIKSYSVLVPLLIGLSILFTIWVVKRPQYWQRLTFYLNILLLLYCGVDLLRLVSKAASAPTQNKYAGIKVDPSVVKHKPNVYLIVLDEYAGRKSLQDSFHFGNDSFYNDLQRMGFTTMPATANYNFTNFSMASLLNMGYIGRRDNNKDISQHDFMARLNEIRNARIFSIFREMGYAVHNFSIFDVDNMPAINSGSGDQLLLRHTILLTDKILHNRADRDIGWAISPGIKKWLPFFKDRSFFDQQHDNNKALEATRAFARKHTAAPSFIYTHLLLPHWPYYADSTGKSNPESLVLPAASWSDKSLYLGYLKYANGLITQLLADMVKNDPAAIILLLSDHGFRNYNDTRRYQPLQFDALCAVRMPGIQPTPFNRSHVNFFPWIFNNAFGQQLPFLKDSSVALVDDEPFK